MRSTRKRGRGTQPRQSTDPVAHALYAKGLCGMSTTQSTEENRGPQVEDSTNTLQKKEVLKTIPTD
jgi:hypothetical protein